MSFSPRIWERNGPECRPRDGAVGVNLLKGTEAHSQNRRSGSVGRARNPELRDARPALASVSHNLWAPLNVQAMGLCFHMGPQGHTLHKRTHAALLDPRWISSRCCTVRLTFASGCEELRAVMDLSRPHFGVMHPPAPSPECLPSVLGMNSPCLPRSPRYSRPYPPNTP